MRQTSIEIQHFSRVLICHAPPQHAECIQGHSMSRWLMWAILRGREKITAIQTDRIRWIPALSGWGPIHNRTWVTVQSTAHMDFFVPHSPSFPIHDNKTLQAMSNFEPFYCIIYLSCIFCLFVLLKKISLNITYDPLPTGLDSALIMQKKSYCCHPPLLIFTVVEHNVSIFPQ